MTRELPPLMSIKDLSDYLDVPVTTIYKWRHDGAAPPAMKVGRSLRFRVSDVEAWLDARAERDDR